MPELAVQSTALHSLLPPPARYPFTGWETACVFRETFLAWLTPPGAADAFRLVGNLFFDMLLNADDWPKPEESPVRRELRAAARDLRFVQGWLATALETSEALEERHPDDAHLARLAGRLAPQVGRLAAIVERDLGEERRF